MIVRLLQKYKAINIYSYIPHVLYSTASKEGIFKRSCKHIISYLKIVANDYKTVAIETAQDCKAHPLKSSLIALSCGALTYMAMNRPDSAHYIDKLKQNSLDLWLVGEQIRNPYTESYLNRLGELHYHGKLRYLNLGIVTVVWQQPYSIWCKEYSCICPYTSVDILSWHQHVLDVGILGYWYNLSTCMKDYDVNPLEWDGNGDDAKHTNFTKVDPRHIFN